MGSNKQEFVKLLGSADINSNDEVRTQRRAKGSWRVTVGAGVAVATVVLLTNIGVLAWTIASFGWSSGVTTVYTGIAPQSDACRRNWANMRARIM